MESKVLCVRYISTGKLAYLSAEKYLFNIGDMVVAESDRGVELARIVSKIEPTDERIKGKEIKEVMRTATKVDMENYRRLKEQAKNALKICKKMVKKLKLNMKLITATYTIDETKLIFYFTSEERVDFRELVRDLALEFRTRIELRQVGARDEVKEYPTLGVCGRELCCRTFLPDFDSVTIKTAKEQGLQINMQKLSGCCGKLKCCIKYEEEAYKEKIKTMPKMNETVEYDGEKAKVVGEDILGQRVKLKLGEPGEERFVTVNVDDIKRINKKVERGE